MPTDLGIAEKVSDAREISERLDVEIRHSIALNALHLRGAFQSDVPDVFDDSLEAWGYNLVVFALHAELIMALTRIFDVMENTASLPMLMEILRDTQVVEALCADARNNVPGDAIRQIIKEAHEDLARLRNSHQLARVKTIRNKMLAHLARDWEKSQRAQNRHTIELVEMTFPTIEKLNLALRGENLSYRETASNEEVYADNFWRRAAGLQGKP
ncbi:MAG: hypothetical protein O7G83_20590 [Proteobacteria bacterium]|nr:hypothetical protein [Pseudomonadota bacterium]